MDVTIEADEKDYEEQGKLSSSLVSKANLVCDAVVWRHLVPAPLGTRSSRSRVNTRCQVAPTGSIFLYVRHDESHFVRTAMPRLPSFFMLKEISIP